MRKAVPFALLYVKRNELSRTRALLLWQNAFFYYGEKAGENMIPENKDMFVRCGLARWQTKGYQGQGVKIAVIDQECQSDKDMEGWAKFPLGEWKTGGHGVRVAKALHEVAPKTEIHCFSYLGADDNQRRKIVDYIIHNGYDLVNISLAVINSKNEPLELLKNTNIPVIAASGNDGKENFLKYPASENWTIAVGAFSENLNQVANYSNGGDGLDCLGYGGVYHLNTKGKAVEFTGTSCAAPFVTGMLACWLSYCKEIDYRPTRQQVKEFVISHCLDYEEEGKDRRSGYGLFILPNKLEPVRISMKLGEKTAIVNGKTVPLDVAPLTKNDRTMVPIRFVSEALGAQVDYIDKEQKVEIVL